MSNYVKRRLYTLGSRQAGSPKREVVMAFPWSEVYLEVDSKRCAGCVNCMLACSLVHEGEKNIALSKIQIIQNVFEPYPNDIQVVVCKQCARPLCIEACSTGACYIDTVHGNMRAA